LNEFIVNEDICKEVDLESDSVRTVQPKYTRHHSRQHVQKQQVKFIENVCMAKFKNSSIAHVLLEGEMQSLKDKGMVFIHVTRPTQHVIKGINVIKWTLCSSSLEVL